MSTGEGTPTEFSTQRAREFPTIRQFTVFLENRVGMLMEVLSVGSKRYGGSEVL